MGNSSYYTNIFHNFFRYFMGMYIPFQVLIDEDTKEFSRVNLRNYHIVNYKLIFRGRDKLFTGSKYNVVGFSEI